MAKLNFINGKIINGKIIAELTTEEISERVAKKEIFIVKNLFPEEQLLNIRKLVREWGLQNPAVTVDDFRGNYHSMKAKVSNIQQSPHIFHDYNFNNLNLLNEDFKMRMFEIFEPLRGFYNSLTGYNAPLGVIENAPYFHPQFIHYPLGGGFFGRHNHNLLPQKIGFILSLSRYKTDYNTGGTCFVIDNEIIDIEGKLDIGDLCLWPNDVDHWVKQSSLEDFFDWNSELGRWVVTFAYFNPF